MLSWGIPKNVNKMLSNITIFFRFLVVISVFFVLPHPAVSQSTYKVNTVGPTQVYQFQYHSYRKVTLFSFNVPQKTLVSTWTVNASVNGKETCHKNITLDFHHAGYPRSNPTGAKYPEKFVINRTHTHTINLMSNTSVAGTARNPLSGNWYAAAYLPEKTTRNFIGENHISFSCHFILNMSQTVTTHDSVQELVVPQATESVIHIPANEDIHYLRFVLPEGVTSYQVIVNSCFVGKQTSDLANITCPIAIYSEALSLPKTVSASTNCSKLMSTPCIHINYRPAPNVWNYLGIIKNTNESVKLKLRIMYQACSTFVDNPSWDVLNGLPKENWYLSDPNATCTKEMCTIVNTTEPATDDQGCLMHHPMEKCPTSLAFTYSFAYPDANNKTNCDNSCVNITDAILVSTFHLDPPNTDGGGTLKLKAEFPKSQNNATEDVLVEFCLQKNVIPVNGTDIICDSGYMITINTSSKLVADWLYVPYPEEGQWYLAIKRTCYLEDLVANESVAFQKCVENETKVLYSVSSKPCFENDCIHGNCYIPTSNGAYKYSTCNCYQGYRGYGCTDDREAASYTVRLLGVLLLTLSNLFFLPGAILAFKRKYFIHGMVYLCTMFVSTFYHACDENLMKSFCIFKYNTLQDADFFLSYLAFMITLTLVSDGQESLQSIVNMAAVLYLVITIQEAMHSTWLMLVLLACGSVMLIASFGYQCRKKKSCYPDQRRWLCHIIPGAVLAIAAFVSSKLENDVNYQYCHSIWHALLGLAILFVLPSKQERPKEQYEAVPILIDADDDNGLV